MKKWETLEEWLYDNRLLGGSFTSHDVADGLRISGPEATQHIKSYLTAQRSPTSTTLYVLHREGRTSRSIWFAGMRAADVKATSSQFFDDVAHRFFKAVELDLVRIGEINPRMRRRCERIIEAVGKGALVVLRAAVDGIDDDGAPV